MQVRKNWALGLRVAALIVALPLLASANSYVYRGVIAAVDEENPAVTVNVKCQPSQLGATSVSLKDGELAAEPTYTRYKQSGAITIVAQVSGDRLFGPHHLRMGEPKSQGRIGGRLHKSSMPTWGFGERNAKQPVKKLREGTE
jgi:hypothetical protein